MDFAFAAKVFAAPFAIMNPIANLPIFLSLTSDMSEGEQRRTAILVTVTVAVGCVVSALAGSAILGFFGLDVDHFRLAGGLIVLLIALSMLHGEDSATHGGSGAEKATFNAADGHGARGHRHGDAGGEPALAVPRPHMKETRVWPQGRYTERTSAAALRVMRNLPLTQGR